MREEHYAPTLHAWSYCAFFAQFFGYFLLSALIEVYFYKLRSEKEISWKIQPNGWKKWPGIRRKQNRKNTFSSFALSVPLLDFFTSSRPDENNTTSASSISSTTKRHPKHRTFASMNLVVSSLFALMVTELTVRGKSSINKAAMFETSAFAIGIGLFYALLLQSALEYPWHRLMHHKFFYKRMHKYHHEYKSPVVYCDLFIHPLEAFGYYCILYSPAFALKDLPKESFLLYMAILGVFGVLDHSGVDFRLPWFLFSYEARFHDLHHKHFNVNYAFPFQWPDRIFGTLKTDC
jgi:sterol desaturase/sphingolipid hydroxylase (fatty acid hydroxylase superfamily)